MTTPTIYERFEKELKLQGYSPETIPAYVRYVSGLVWYYQRQPDQISAVELRQYLIHLVFERKRSYKGIVSVITGLRAFFRCVLHRSKADIKEMLPTLIQRPPPDIYSPEEIERILGVNGLRIEHRTMLMTLYAAGLRINEVCHLKVTDIQSWRMRIRVEQEGPQNERYTVLSPELLKILRNYWRIFRPSLWLFASPRDPSLPVHPSSPLRAFNRAIKLAGLPNRGSVPSLRHSFAVHMLESGLNLQNLQHFLGHRWIVPTTIYIHLMRPGRTVVKNPLGLLHADQAVDESEGML